MGIRLLDHAKETYATIAKSWVDTGFKNAVVEHGAHLGIDVEVVNRDPGKRAHAPHCRVIFTVYEMKRLARFTDHSCDRIASEQG